MSLNKLKEKMFMDICLCICITIIVIINKIGGNEI